MKKIVCILLVCVCALSFVGCGKFSKQTTKYATAEEITAFFKEKKLNLEDYKNAHTDLKYTVKEYRSDYESSYKLTAKGNSIGQDVSFNMTASTVEKSSYIGGSAKTETTEKETYVLIAKTSYLNSDYSSKGELGSSTSKNKVIGDEGKLYGEVENILFNLTLVVKAIGRISDPYLFVFLDKDACTIIDSTLNEYEKCVILFKGNDITDVYYYYESSEIGNKETLEITINMGKAGKIKEPSDKDKYIEN